MPGLLLPSEDLAFMAQATTGDQADTPTMGILIGIVGSGGTVTGAIGRARRDEGPAKSGLFRVALSAVVRRLPDEG
jgi:hypothetical protein